MASGERFARALFGVLILVVFIWFFLVGILESGNTKTNRTLSSQSRTTKGTKGSLKHVKVIGGVDKLHVHPSSDLNYMSKRRVPNGPDPIHNRRSGNSGRPPGQA